MNNRRVLLDSNILILASVGQIAMRAIVALYDEVLVSVISEVEGLGFSFTDAGEEELARNALAATTILPFSAVEAQYAISYRKASKIKFPDAAILATARAVGADLLTQNLADFRGRDAAVRVLSMQDL